jgi:hypothetical protein
MELDVSNIEAFKPAAPTTGPRFLVGHGELTEVKRLPRRKGPADLVVTHVDRARAASIAASGAAPVASRPGTRTRRTRM